MPYGQASGQGYNNPVNNRIAVIAPGKNEGIFVYSPVAGTGDLVVSIAAVSGTDQYGNAYKGPGIEVQSAGDAGQSIFIGLSGGGAVVQFPTGAAIENTPSVVSSSTIGSGATEYIAITLHSASVNTTGHEDTVNVLLNSANEGGTSTANGNLIYTTSAGASTSAAVWDNLGLHVSNLLIPFSGVKPAQDIGSSQIWGDNDYPNVLSGLAGDTNVYDICKARFFASGGALTTSLVAAAGISAIPVGALTYEFYAQLWFTNTAGVPTVTVQVNGPAVSAMRLKSKWTQAGVANTIIENSLTAIGSSTTSPAMTATGTSILELQGYITFSASGATFGISAECSVAGPSLLINSFVTLEPHTT